MNIPLLRDVITALPSSGRQEAMELHTLALVAGAPEDAVAKLLGPFTSLWEVQCAVRDTGRALECLCDVADAESGMVVESVEVISDEGAKTAGKVFDLYTALCMVGCKGSGG